jgi:hypothetical protein
MHECWNQKTAHNKNVDNWRLLLEEYVKHIRNNVSILLMFINFARVEKVLARSLTVVE